MWFEIPADARRPDSDRLAARIRGPVGGLAAGGGPGVLVVTPEVSNGSPLSVYSSR